MVIDEPGRRAGASADRGRAGVGVRPAPPRAGHGRDRRRRCGAGDVVLRDIVGASPSEIVRVSSRISIVAVVVVRIPRSPEEIPRVATQATIDSTLSTLTIHAGTDAHDADTPVVHPLYQSVNFIQEIGTDDGPALSALRQLAERRGRAGAHRGARGRGGGGAARQRHGRDRVRAARLLRPGDHLIASSCDLWRGDGAPHEGVRGARHRRVARRSVRTRASGDDACAKRRARSSSRRR